MRRRRLESSRSGSSRSPAVIACSTPRIRRACATSSATSTSGRPARRVSQRAPRPRWRTCAIWETRSAKEFPCHRYATATSSASSALPPQAVLDPPDDALDQAIGNRQVRRADVIPARGVAFGPDGAKLFAITSADKRDHARVVRGRVLDRDHAARHALVDLGHQSLDRLVLTFDSHHPRNPSKPAILLYPVALSPRLCPPHAATAGGGSVGSSTMTGMSGGSRISSLRWKLPLIMVCSAPRRLVPIRTLFTP